MQAKAPAATDESAGRMTTPTKEDWLILIGSLKTCKLNTSILDLLHPDFSDADSCEDIIEAAGLAGWSQDDILKAVGAAGFD